MSAELEENGVGDKCDSASTCAMELNACRFTDSSGASPLLLLLLRLDDVDSPRICTSSVDVVSDAVRGRPTA